MSKMQGIHTIQMSLDEKTLGDNLQYLKDSMIIKMLYYEAEIIGVEFPNFVELEVIQTDPGFKGDTATGGNKPATVETGAVIAVPLFINIGDVIQIDTRTKTYLKRV